MVDMKRSHCARWMGQTREVLTHANQALHTYVCVTTPAPRPSQKPICKTFFVFLKTHYFIIFLVLHFITSSLPLQPC